MKDRRFAKRGCTIRRAREIENRKSRLMQSSHSSSALFRFYIRFKHCAQFRERLWNQKARRWANLIPHSQAPVCWARSRKLSGRFSRRSSCIFFPFSTKKSKRCSSQIILHCHDHHIRHTKFLASTIVTLVSASVEMLDIQIIFSIPVCAIIFYFLYFPFRSMANKSL